MAWRSLRTASRLVVGRKLDLTVEGREWLPASGPAILAARHFHHLYDGCAIMASVPRPVHILVALDWVQNPIGKRVMGGACRAAGWPVVLRRSDQAAVDTGPAIQAVRRATRESVAHLRDGRLLLVFPEAYPNIDPGFTPKTDETSFLRFRPGVVRLAALAANEGRAVPIIPVGFSYRRGDRWQVDLRFGEPVTIGRNGEAEALREVEAAVRRLSTPPGTERGPG